MNYKQLRNFKMTKIIAGCVVATVLSATTMSAREFERAAQVQREMRIVADVMKSVLREELHKDIRVTRVEPQYLAEQGVLLSVNLSAPWLTINEQGETSIQFNGQISIPEIPRMVEEILTDLEIDITSYEPQAVEDLHELRTEQRELRLEQRHLRSELRRKRREQIRTDSDDESARLDQHIVSLENDLVRAEADYERLAADIDRQYERLRSSAPPLPPKAPKPAKDIDQVVAQSACDYGATLKSLTDDEFLTIALHRGDTKDYYAFRMDDINECSQSDIDSERLLKSAYQYSN